MSEKYISPAEREYIAKAWRNYASVAEIATHLGKSRKTIYAELRRGQDGEKLDRNQRPVYDPELAQRRFQANLRRRGKPQQAGTGYGRIEKEIQRDGQKERNLHHK